MNPYHDEKGRFTNAEGEETAYQGGIQIAVKGKGASFAAAKNLKLTAAKEKYYQYKKSEYAKAVKGINARRGGR